MNPDAQIDCFACLFGMLTDKGLEASGLLLTAAELAGCMPPQLWFVLVVLMAKAAGGFRPMGIFPAIYKLWGTKTRRPVC